jgi:hypothetical protein
MRFATIAAAAALLVGGTTAARADIVSDWYETEVAASKASETPESSFDPETAQSFSKLTLAIISPPPIHGGMASSRSRLPYNTPMPVGPHIL